MGLITFSANCPHSCCAARKTVQAYFADGGLLAGNPAVYLVGTTLPVYTIGPRAADT
jgi:hypothetical protein